MQPACGQPSYTHIFGIFECIFALPKNDSPTANTPLQQQPPTLLPLATCTMRSYKVTVKNDDASEKKDISITYTLRGLEESEIPTWAQFCASVFAYKAQPPPASYFERHYYNDPNRQAALIRVACIAADDDDSQSQKIVASCRVFERSLAYFEPLSVASASSVEQPAEDSGRTDNVIRAGGIGEVCTAADHRRRGLSKELLKDCIEIMTTQGMQTSLLHAAPTFFPVYQSMGYQCTTSHWSLITASLLTQQSSSNGYDTNTMTEATSGGSNWTIRLASFPNDTPTLFALHQSFSEKHRLVGCLHRSVEYWNTYLSIELQGSLFVLQNNHHNSNIVAWLSLRPGGGTGAECRWQVRDFGYDYHNSSSTRAVTISRAFHILLCHALSQQQQQQESFRLHLPTFLLDEVRHASSVRDDGHDTYDQKMVFTMDWGTIQEQNDYGWMYRPIGPNGISAADLLHVSSQPRDANKDNHHHNDRPPPQHLIWPADSF